jgi:hypothetical protein
LKAYKLLKIEINLNDALLKTLKVPTKPTRKAVLVAKYNILGLLEISGTKFLLQNFSFAFSQIFTHIPNALR